MTGSHGLPQDASALVRAEDVVRWRDGPGPGGIGIVTQVYGQSDDEALSEDEEEQLLPGQARVIWLQRDDEADEGDEEIDGEVIEDATEALVVADRALTFGDVVARVEDTLAQTGVVVSVRLELDLVQELGARDERSPPISYTPLLRGVASSHLRQLRSMHVGEFVTLGAWLGQADAVCDALLLRQGEALVLVKDVTMDTILPHVNATLQADQDDCPYFPGQRVSARTAGVMRSGRWLQGSWRGSLHATVEAVEPGEARVRWIAALGGLPPGEDPADGLLEPPMPSPMQQVAHLTRLSAFDSITWQIGDRGLIRKDVAEAAARAGGSPAAFAAAVAAVEEAEKAAAAEVAAADAAAAAEVAEEAGEGWHSANKRKSRRRAQGGGGGRSRTRSPGTDLPSSGAAGAASRAGAGRSAADPPTLVARVVGTRTLVVVQWQDGTRSEELPASRFVPVTHLVEGDYWSDEFVQDKSDDPTSPQPAERAGLIRSVDAAGRTARVSWLGRDALTGRLALPSTEAELPPSELVSVYDIEPALELNFRVGDAVLKLDVDAPLPPSSSPLPERNSASSWVGQVVAMSAGWLTVAWADGRTSRLQPDEVFPVQADDDGDEEDEGEDEEEWEAMPPEAQTFNGHGHATLPGPPGGFGGWIAAAAQRSLAALGGAGAGGEAEEGAEPPPARRLPPSASQMMALMASHGLHPVPPAAEEEEEEEEESSEGWKTETSEDLPPGLADVGVSEESEGGEAASEAAEEARRMAVMFASLPPLPTATAALVPPPPPAPAPPSAPAPAPTPAPSSASTFPLFETVTGSEDHLYLIDAAGGGSSGSFGDRAWSKAIRRDWSLLRGGLPEDGSLLVRCYEERTDLVRACIRGASETPYHRHLFFFDLQFGVRYPLEPPGVTYWAHGLRCNPNLYANGKVCLSLLGTWSGRDGEHGETWRPNESSALQVLLSIQALVLNEKPYFNEAGWGGQMGSEEGERNSRLYNEQVRLVCLRSSLALLRAPPLHFEAVVEGHYRREGGAILSECEAELAEEGPARPSEGYKASLSKLMPRLREALGPGAVDVNGLD